MSQPQDCVYLKNFVSANTKLVPSYIRVLLVNIPIRDYFCCQLTSLKCSRSFFYVILGLPSPISLSLKHKHVMPSYWGSFQLSVLHGIILAFSLLFCCQLVWRICFILPNHLSPKSSHVSFCFRLSLLSFSFFFCNHPEPQNCSTFFSRQWGLVGVI